MPNTTKFVLLQGVLLLKALEKSRSQTVKWLRTQEGLDNVVISTVMAIAIARTSVLEGKCSADRVYYIANVPPVPPLSDEHYQDDRAVTKFHGDQTACVPRHIKDQRRVDLWDKMLHRVEYPRSWQAAKRSQIR